MPSSAVIDTVIGMIFVFYALALLCGGAVEMIANWMRKRGKYLIRGLQDLLHDVDPSSAAAQRQVGWAGAMVGRIAPGTGAELASYAAALNAGGTPTDGGRRPPDGPAEAVRAITVEDVMGHPLVQPFRHASSLGKPTRNPSYLPGPAFARTVVDLLATPTTGKQTTAADLETGIASLQGSPQLQRALAGLLQSAKGDVDAFAGAVEQWFDAQMDRVTGSYKRWAKRWVMVIATVVVLAGGLDSIAIARALYANDALRAAAVQRANEPDFCPTGESDADCAKLAQAFLTKAGLPIGWSAPNPADENWGVPLKILGLLISVGAAGVGAPFWYRLLDRVGTLRNTGRRPAEGGAGRVVGCDRRPLEQPPSLRRGEPASLRVAAVRPGPR